VRNRLVLIRKDRVFIKNGGPEGTLLEPASIVAKLLVERNYGRIFRIPNFAMTQAPELDDEFKYIL